MYEKYALLLDKYKTTSYQVSKATGIGNATLSDWKNGRYTPKIDKLQAIAAYFGVPLGYFLEDASKTASE